MFGTPLIVGVSKIITIKFDGTKDMTDPQWLTLFLMEAILIVDFLACFFKIPRKMVQPTLSKTV